MIYLQITNLLDMKPFAKTCEDINAVSSKLEKVRILSEYLKDLNDRDLHLASIFFTGTAFAARDIRKLNLGGQMIKKAVAQCVGMIDEEGLKKIDSYSLQFSEPGDFAQYVLETYRKNKKTTDISLEVAEQFFNKIFETSGSIAKVKLLTELYDSLDPLIAKYISKILAGDLRIGLKEASVEEAISKAFEKKSADVKNANMFIGDIGEVAVLSKNTDLQNIHLTPFWPVKAMLATPAEDADEIIKRMGTTLWVEDKYDGVRAQIHKFGDEIKLFSRDQNEITHQFPEIVEYLKPLKHDVILDGEIMAFKNGQIMRFFFIQQRLGRKKISEEILKEIPVQYFVYDFLYLDGKELLDFPLEQRRELAEKTLGKTNTKYNDTNINGVHFSHQQIVNGIDELEKAFNEAKERITEGLMVKKQDSFYKPGRRGIEWLKYKKALEPLDVVITGAEYGHGKRRSQLSDYTFAVRDKKSGELVNIGKAYSGITDEEIKMFTEKFLAETIEEFGRYRTVEPNVVLEVMFESIQKSARHKSGFALRFPRITKIRMGDKGLDDINTLQDVEKMYEKYFANQDINEDMKEEFSDIVKTK